MMKTRLASITLLLAQAVLLISCAKDSRPGQIRFSLGTDGLLKEDARSSLSDYVPEMPQAADFNLKITNRSTGATVWSGKFNEWNSESKIPAGAYSVSAIYGDTSDEGFEKPCLEGKKDFVITAGSTSNEEISVSTANTLVKIVCTDTFKKYYPEYTFTIRTSGGSAISYPKQETRPVFMDNYAFSIEGSMTAQNGENKSFTSKEYDNLEAAHCYTVSIDAKGVGGIGISISFNNNVNTVNLEDDLNE